MKRQQFRRIRWGMSMVLLPTFAYWLFRAGFALNLSGEAFGCSTLIEERVFKAFFVIYFIFGFSFLPEWLDWQNVLRGKHNFVWEARPSDYERAIEHSIDTANDVNPRLDYWKWWVAGFGLVGLLMIADKMICRFL